MFERSLGIKLTLLPAFAEATKLILSDIGEINKGLQSINENGNNIKIDGLKTLGSELSNVAGAAERAKIAIESLNGVKISKNVLSALEIGMKNVGVAAKEVKQGIQDIGTPVNEVKSKIQELGVQATTTSGIIQAESKEAANSILDIAKATMYAEMALQKLGLFAMPKMQEPIIGMRNLASEIGLAEQALRKLDTFAPKQLQDTVLRLQSGMQNLIALSGSAPPLMLGPGVPTRTNWQSTQYGLNSNSGVIGTGPNPKEIPLSSITGNRPSYYLPPGDYEGHDIVPYGTRPMSPRSTPYTPGNGYQTYQGSGAIAPFVQTVQGQWVGGGGGGPVWPPGGTPPMPPPNYGGNALSNAGRGIMRHGDIMQSAGWSAAMNAIILNSVAEPLLKQQTDLDDLYKAAAEAYQSAGMTPKTAAAFSTSIENQSKQYGGDLRQNISGGYTFVSSMPALSHVNWNDPKQLKEMEESYGKIIQQNIAGSRSTHPIQLEHSILDAAAMVTNLGMPEGNTKELSSSLNKVVDWGVRVKNATATEVDLLGSSIRQLGQLSAAMGTPPEETVGIIAAEAQGKIRGGVAGTYWKRVLTRQITTPKQVLKVENLLKQFGVNASMFNKDGSVRSTFDFLGDIGNFENEHHLPSKQRGELATALAGNYAIPGLSELIRFSSGIGGSKGFAKYTHDLLHGPIEGQKPGEDATQTYYKTRANKNLKIEGQKTSNDFGTEMHKTFQMMEPDLVAGLKLIDKLITAWHGLPDPVKKSALEFAGLSTIILGIVGVSGILVGNFLKIIGSLTYAGGAALKLTEHLIGARVVFPQLTGAINLLGQATNGIIPAAFNAARISVTGLLTALGPIGIAIGVVIAATGLFSLAWSKDWGGIREKVAGFPEYMGEIIGRTVVWFHHIPEHLQQAGQQIISIWKGVFQGLGNICNSAFTLVDDIFIKHKFPELHWPTPPAWINKLLGMPAQISSQFQAGLTKGTTEENKEEGISSNTDGSASGQAFGIMYGAGTVKGLQTAKGQIKQGLQPISDLFPHSEPKDSSSPLHGATSSGQSYSDMFIAGAIDALFTGAPKLKKAAKPLGDVFLDVKNDSISQVRDMAKKIEAEFTAMGAHWKNRNIFLGSSTHPGEGLHVQGNIEAYKMAIHGAKPSADLSAQKAKDYLLKIKREIESGGEVNINQAIAHLQNLAIHALSEHAISQINQMIFELRKASKKAGDTIERAFEITKKGFETHLASTGRAGDKFDLIQQDMSQKIPQLSTDPTTKDLKNVISAERSERDALASTLLNEQEDAKELAVKYAELNAEISKLNGTSAYEQQIREKLREELGQVGNEYQTVTNRIQSQTSVVDTLSKSIKDQTGLLNTAKDTWNGLFYNIQQKSIQGSIDGNIKSIADHVQNYFQLQNDPKGSAGNSPIRQQANNYANSMFQELFQGMFGTSSTSILEKITHKGNKKEGIQETTQYIEKVDKSNDFLSKIEKNTQYLDPKKMPTSGIGGNNGNPLDVTLRPDGGGEDLGSKMVDGIISTNPASLSSELQSQQNQLIKGLPGLNEGASSETSLQKFQGLAGQASEAMGVLNGMRAGGVGGALQAGSSALALTGNPYVAGAAALVGFIGIGPHETPAQQPDINDPTYQKLLPNWAGTQQDLNGTAVQPDQQYSKYAGNQNQAQQMYAFVSNPSSQIGMNPDQQTAIQKMMALAGGMGAAGLAIKSEHQGNLLLASGQTISVTDFEQLLTTDQGMLTQFQNNALQQQQNSDRLAASFTSFVLGGPNGFTMPDFVGGGSGKGISNSGIKVMPSQSMPVLSRNTSSQPPSPGPVTVNILAGATISGNHDQIVAALEQHIPAIVQAVENGQYQNNRLSGNYASSF